MKKIFLTLIILSFLVKGYSQKEKIHYFKLTDTKFKVGAIYYIDLSKLKNHFYICGQYNDDEQEFDSIVSFLNRNPKLEIEIGYHTDYRKIPMTNDTLSQKRADRVKDYFIVWGINQNRLVAKGYGSNKPLYLTKETSVEYKGRDGKVNIFTFKKGVTLNEEYINTLKTHDEKEAACQLCRRIEIKIIGDDFKLDNNK